MLNRIPFIDPFDLKRQQQDITRLEEEKNRARVKLCEGLTSLPGEYPVVYIAYNEPATKNGYPGALNIEYIVPFRYGWQKEGFAVNRNVYSLNIHTSDYPDLLIKVPDDSNRESPSLLIPSEWTYLHFLRNDAGVESAMRIKIKEGLETIEAERISNLASAISLPEKLLSLKNIVKQLNLSQNSAS